MKPEIIIRLTILFLFLTRCPIPHCDERPDSTGGQSPKLTNANLSPQLIEELLSPEKHLSNILAISSCPQHPSYELYMKQKEAIRLVGEKKLSQMAPRLILYLDYPRDFALGSIVRWTVAESPSALQNARVTWPAFDAIVRIGKETVPSLQAFIEDSTHKLEFRIAALEVLAAVDISSAERMGKQVLDSLEQVGQTSAVIRVRSVLEGKEYFSGIKPLLKSESIRRVRP
jgi:hypothetical protein